MTRILVFVLSISAVFGQTAERRLYFANDDHTDYMWTANEDTYRRVFLEMVDYYLDLADQTAANPSECQSRWNLDGNLWAWTYEKNRTEEEFARLIERIKSGHVSVPLNAVVSCYGGMPAEAVLRGMLYAGDLERRHGIRIPVAVAMENQTLPYGLGALWAGAGAKYSWKGICGCATKLDKMRQRPHEIYWWRGMDGSRILMKWNSLYSNNVNLGGYAEAQNLERSLKLVENDERFKARWPFPVVGVFGKGEDKLKTLTDEFVRFATEKTTPERKIIVSNEVDFFEDFEKHHGKDLPEFSASFGNEWDVYSASMSEVSAVVRRAVEKLRTAEALATLVALKDPGFMERRKQARDQAWINLGLYWEHNWTADGPVVTRQARAAWQRRLAGQIDTYVNDLMRESAEVLGGLIPSGKGSQRFFVFNSLGWARGGAADLPYEGSADVHVVELATGRTVPSQVVMLPDPEYFSGRRYLRLLAGDIPAVGYKVFEIREGKGEEFPQAATFAGGIFENSAYRLKVDDRGVLTSLVDKSMGDREFARRLNELEGTGAPGMIAVENAGPVSVTVKAMSPQPLAHTSRFTLYQGSRRIEIDNEITQNFGHGQGYTGVQEWNFHFNVEAPDVHHEEVGAVLRAKLTTEGGHYSPVNSRLEWLTLNHFAAMSGKDGAGVTLSNRDCAFFRLGHSQTVDRQPVFDTSLPIMRVLAGGQIDFGRGIENQDGDSYFLQRFSLQPYAAYSAVESMKVALEHQNPLLASRVRGGTGYPETSFSLVTLSAPDVLLWALKPAEDGMESGIVARLWNLESQPRDVKLSLAGGVDSAAHVTHVETETGPAAVEAGSVSARLEASAMRTLRLVPAKGTSAAARAGRRQ